MRKLRKRYGPKHLLFGYPSHHADGTITLTDGSSADYKPTVRLRVTSRYKSAAQKAHRDYTSAWTYIYEGWQDSRKYTGRGAGEGMALTLRQVGK